ncbi:MAG: hypothetical protein K2Y37_14295, partial [Pirellulales bacterium]|nr:hypothetical protein [Pirellulales bacterium]
MKRTSEFGLASQSDWCASHTLQFSKLPWLGGPDPIGVPQAQEAYLKSSLDKPRRNSEFVGCVKRTSEFGLASQSDWCASHTL